ncbi:hypothetical protein K1T71_014275 [Dendrolimus kikuchii]|uniref:Uncharacterized protein n=1 Tax=Dendrolimus kikuchii TaxID=765133 RepID=A0ACC1CFX7_9NEOP|nr:hypothetical protein K1T71_014275 [Dendrolimus kikuchii]
MHWFGGSIAEAVILSKEKNAIFVVFVEGENDLSAEMAATIDDAAVVSRLADQTTFLAVKLKSGSTNYMHFAQIYQFVPVPSLFFIGRNGTPLEVVCAGVEANNLATRIDRILEEHRKEKQSTIQPSTSAQDIKAQTVNLLQSEAQASETQDSGKREKPADNEPETSSGPAAKIQKTETTQSEDFEVVCDGDVCVRRPKTGDEPGPSQIKTTPVVEEKKEVKEPEPENQQPETETEGSIEEKLERAKELIEARRREKADKEKELEKQKELERRAQGQGVVELKKWQADQELKNIQEERKREKMENNLARQRILEQIAQDRAERRARDAPPPAQTQAQPSVTVPATSGDGGNRARIQFKLPDGTSHTAHFDADDTLEVLHRYVTDNLQMTRSSFSLWLAFPRRELSEPSDTLRGLQLAPSAALLVLPTRQAAVPPRPSQVAFLTTLFTQLFTTLFVEPFQYIYTWIRSRLFPPPPTRRSPSPSPAPRNAPPPVRRRGNIHRLGGDGSPDDDNNTWNGNSTQQM